MVGGFNKSGSKGHAGVKTDISTLKTFKEERLLPIFLFSKCFVVVLYLQFVPEATSSFSFLVSEVGL